MAAVMPVITTRFDYGPLLGKPYWRQVLKSAWQAVGQHWHAQMLPKHFTTAGAHEYGYQNRTKRYQIRKARKRGHQQPIVWSGTTRTAATRIRDVRATADGCRVILRGIPAYVWMQGHGARASAPNLPLELTTVSAREVTELTGVLNDAIETFVDEYRGAANVFDAAGHRSGAMPAFGHRRAA